MSMAQINDWPPKENLPAPSIDPGLQAQLDLIGGRVLDGRPKIRLVWGQDPRITVFWQGEQRLRYLYRFDKVLVGWRDSRGRIYPPTQTPPKADFVGSLAIEPLYANRDIGIPRWFIEQMMPASIMCDGWAKERMDFEDGEVIDSLGPEPSLGDYAEAFYKIADHEECCGTRFVPGCPGSYRSPNQGDIEYVRWLMRNLQEEGFRYSWEDIPPPEVVVQDIKDRRSQAFDKALARQEETSYIIRSAIAHKKAFGGGHFDMGEAFRKARRF